VARPGPVDTVYLGVFRRQALEAVGGYDPAFVRNQDAELNLRLRRAGYQVWFDPQLAVRYRPRGSVASLARQYREYGAYRRLTARRHPRSLAPRQLAAPAVVLGLAGAAASRCSPGTRGRRRWWHGRLRGTARRRGRGRRPTSPPRRPGSPSRSGRCTCPGE
jgi:GT2 family glycosyltransferase